MDLWCKSIGFLKYNCRRQLPVQKEDASHPVTAPFSHALPTEVSSVAARETFLNDFFGGRSFPHNTPSSDWAVGGAPVQNQSNAVFFMSGGVVSDRKCR